MTKTGEAGQVGETREGNRIGCIRLVYTCVWPVDDPRNDDDNHN